MNPYFNDAGITLYVGDCLEVLPGLPGESVDAVVTDPPYGLGFMGRDWDHGVPGVHFWQEIMRVAKPGAHLLAFGGTRTHHRLVCAIEDAGWEIRDTIMWVYGSGFPKSLDVSKAIDKEAGAERQDLGPSPTHHGGGTNHVYAQDVWTRENFANKARLTAPATEAAKQWDGWGTALKPAVEPIVLARKPLIGTVSANVQRYGTGALNIDASRIGTSGGGGNGLGSHFDRLGATEPRVKHGADVTGSLGRWPANLIHDGSPEVVECFPESESTGRPAGTYKGMGYHGAGLWPMPAIEASSGSASRFFYCCKASKADRYSEAGNDHPTVKPLALIQYLVRLITPPGGLVLDPFLGSGTTAKAAHELGFRCIGIDLEERHCEIAAKRLTQTVLDFGGAA